MKDAAICLEIPAGIMQTSAQGRWFLIHIDECNPLFIILIYAFLLYFIAVSPLFLVLSLFFENAIIWQHLLSTKMINYSLLIGTHYFDGLIKRWREKKSLTWIPFSDSFEFWDFHDKLNNSIDLELYKHHY